MIIFPNAKINLGLSVLRRNEDGFHEIETVMYPVPYYYDVLEFLPSEKFTLSIYGLEVTGKHKENLLYKMWKLLRDYHQVRPVEIKLLKMIPPGSGLGGGSSDAVFFLKAMNDYFGLSLDKKTLNDYSARTGSDCPFFVHNTAAVVRGRGHQLNNIRLSLKDKFLVIVFPGIHIATAEAYRHTTPHLQDVMPGKVLELPISMWRNLLMNDFEQFIFEKHPRLREIKHAFYEMGAIYASLTGSGSAIYAIFDRSINLNDKFPGFYVRSGFLK